MQAAAEADEARARGDSVGLLGGVPVAVKDVFLTRGVRTTAGSRVLAEAQRLRRVWVAKWRRLMAGHGLAAVAHPTLDAPPPLIESSRPPKGPSIRPSVPWTIAGFPVLSVPAGLDDRGLPVGLSLAGLPEREAEVVGLGVVIDEEVQLWRREPKISP